MHVHSEKLHNLRPVSEPNCPKGQTDVFVHRIACHMCHRMQKSLILARGQRGVLCISYYMYKC